MLDDRFQPQGRGIAKLMLHPLGAEFFRFWQDGKLLYDDVTQRVDDHGLVLRPVDRGGELGRGRILRWRTKRVRACSAVRVAGAGSQVLHEADDGSMGEELGIPLPHLGCHLLDIFLRASCLSQFRLRSTGCFFFAAFWAPGSTVDTCAHVSSEGFWTDAAISVSLLALIGLGNLEITSACPLLLAVARPVVHATVHGDIWKNSSRFLVKECSRCSHIEIWKFPYVPQSLIRGLPRLRSTRKLDCSGRRLQVLFAHSASLARQWTHAHASVLPTLC